MVDVTSLEGAAHVASWAIVPLAIWRYQIVDTRRFLGFNAMIGAMVATIYAMEGGMAGAWVSVASASALATQFAVGHKISLTYRMMIAAPAIAFAVVLKEPGWIALLPLVSFCLARIAEAVRHDLGLRLTLLFCTSLWIAYGWILGLPQIVLFEVLGVGSNIIGIWRVYGPKN